MNPFAPAQKFSSTIRFFLEGPPGSGKTFSALLTLLLAAGGTDNGDGTYSLRRKENGQAQIAIIDTERRSARLYAKVFTDGAGGAAYDVMELERDLNESVDPTKMTEAIHLAQKYGYTNLIVDSLSHAWEGVLTQKDMIDKANPRSNSYTNWRNVTPIHTRLINAVLDYKGNIIACMRVKTDMVMVEDERGKSKPVKMGLKPIQRDNVEYEADMVVMLSRNGQGYILKSRAHVDGLRDGQEVVMNKDWILLLKAWLNDGIAYNMTEEDMMAKLAAVGFKDKAHVDWFCSTYEIAATATDELYNAILDKLAALAK